MCQLLQVLTRDITVTNLKCIDFMKPILATLCKMSAGIYKGIQGNLQQLDVISLQMEEKENPQKFLHNLFQDCLDTDPMLASFGRNFNKDFLKKAHEDLFASYRPSVPSVPLQPAKVPGPLGDSKPVIEGLKKQPSTSSNDLIPELADPLAILETSNVMNNTSTDLLELSKLLAKTAPPPPSSRRICNRSVS